MAAMVEIHASFFPPMKLHRLLPILSIAATFMTALLAGCDRSAKSREVPPLTIRESTRGVDPLASYAPVVEKVALAVVTVFTSKNLSRRPNTSPLLDDPLLRRFFGGRSPQRAPEER